MSIKEFEKEQLLGIEEKKSEIAKRMVAQVRDFAKNVELERVSGEDNSHSTNDGFNERFVTYGTYKEDLAFIHTRFQCQRSYCPFETSEWFTVYRNKEEVWQHIQSSSRPLSYMDRKKIKELLEFDINFDYNARDPSIYTIAKGVSKPRGGILSTEIGLEDARELTGMLMLPVKEFIRVNHIEIPRKIPL